MKSRYMQDTRQLFLWSMGVIFLFAFTSLFVQIPGLYGTNGLLPVYNVVPKQQIDKLSFWEHLESLYNFPSLLIYSNYLGLPYEAMMSLCTLCGAGLSFTVIVFQSMRCSFIFLLLWLLYLSVHQVGQTFLYFQWDSLLLETGIITVLVAPLNLKFWKKPAPRSHDNLSFWLVRWLLFRLMFASGVVKLTSHCPTWWGLTALNWHYESQCIPTPLSWYAHQLPDWFQRLSVVGTYYIEILVPFMFFLPLRSLRLFAFCNQVFFQVCIILTGNYNFFNLLTIVLCLSLLDDHTLDSTPCSKKRRVPTDWTRKMFKSFFGKSSSWIHSVCRVLMFVAIVGVSVGVVIHLFDVHLSDNKVLSEIVFTKNQFQEFVNYSVLVAIIMGGASLLLELLYTLVDSLSKRGVVNKVWSLTESVVMGGVILLMFSISLVPLSYLDASVHKKLPSEIITIHKTVEPFHLTNSYGLFRRMTGVGGRPELVIEGANNESGPWKEYEFLYKPGHTHKPLPLVAPHQPRLDWQMWFAALGSYEHNPWLVNLVYRLLSGKKEVLDLMAPPPFETPPTFIRVQKYIYHFTKYDHSQSILNQSGPWWTRGLQGDYLFPLSLNHDGLKDYLKQMNLLDIPSSNCSLPYICPLLSHAHFYSKLLPPLELCLAIVTMATILQITLAFLAGVVRPKTTPLHVATPIIIPPVKSHQKQSTQNNSKNNKTHRHRNKKSSEKPEH